jgi:Domain of unknown function (DUF4157)
MARDGRVPGRSARAPGEPGGEPAGKAQPGKRTLTEQLGSDVPRSPPLFDGDTEWETIEELEAELGPGETVDRRVADHVSRTTGQDVSGARVHRGPVAATMAAKRGATAFAVGKNIVMGAGAPAPGTPDGDALLAHELAHTAQQGAAATDPAARKQPIGDEDQAAERDAGMARLGNFAGAIGDVMRTGLQLQRCAEVKPARVTELRGKAAASKLAELGGRLATDPDYSGGRKAIAGSHLQYQLLASPSPTAQVGIYQWTHDGPEGYHAQSIPAVGRPDMIPSAAPVPHGMFVNGHNVGATTMPLPRPGTYTTDAWVRAGVDNGGTLEGYDLHVPHTVEVVPLASARQDAYGKLAGSGKEDDYQKFHDTMDMQMVLLKPGGSDAQGKGHQHQIATTAANPARAQPATLAFEAKDARTDRSKPLTYHWYVSAQTRDEPPKHLGGHGLVTVGARSGYDFGTGTQIEVPTERAGFWVIWYQAKDATGADAGEASYLQTILGGDELAQLEKYDKYMERVDELGGKIDGQKLPLTGIHVSQANANETRLRLFCGKQKGAPSTFLLVDATPGLDPKAHRLEYTSSSGQGVIDQFVAENKYPKGQMQFRVGANALGIPTGERTIETSGMGAIDKLSTGLSVGGMAVMGAGILAAPFTRGQSLQVAVVLAGGLTAAGAAVSLYERLQHAEVSGAGVGLDVAMIASSLISGGTAIRALKSGPAVLLACRTTKFLLWANFTADAVMGLLITVEGVERLAEIIDRKDLPEETKRSEIVRVVTNLVMASMMIAVSASQLRELRTKVETALGRKLAGIGDEVVMALAMLDETTLKTLAPLKDTQALVKLAGALREEPALINLLKTEQRLPTLPGLMKGASADELKFAILRANAHDLGIAAEHTERLVTILRQAGIPAEIATVWGGKAFANLASNANTLAELEKILPLVKSGKITGLENWLAFSGKKVGDDAARTAGELREAARQSMENPSATVDVGGDAKGPKDPAKLGESLKSFDLTIDKGGETQRSVEVGSIEKPVKSGADMVSGVGHAAEKVAGRNAAGSPIPGKHDATIQVSLAKQVDQKASGVIEISPNGDRVRVTKRRPPDHLPMSNLFDEFTEKLSKGDTSNLLDRVNIVDAQTGARLAQYDNIGGIWKRVR